MLIKSKSFEEKMRAK